MKSKSSSLSTNAFDRHYGEFRFDCCGCGFPRRALQVLLAIALCAALLNSFEFDEEVQEADTFEAQAARVVHNNFTLRERDERCVAARFNFGERRRRAFSLVRVPKTGSTALYKNLLLPIVSHYKLEQSKASLDDCVFCDERGVITNASLCAAVGTSPQHNATCAAALRLYALQKKRPADPFFDVHPFITQHVPHVPASIGRFVPPKTPILMEFREPRQRILSVYAMRFWYFFNWFYLLPTIFRVFNLFYFLT